MRLVVPVLAAIVVLAGCGAVEGEPNLAAAAAKTEETGSSRIEISGTESEDGSPTEIDCAGEANYETKRLSMTCEYGGQSGMELVAVGSDTYIRGDILGIGAGSDKWLKLTDESFSDMFSPQALLTMLRRASRRTERIGEAEIRGAETVRYRFEVDCEQAELLDCEGETETSRVDVWIDDDGLVRRIEVAEGSSPFSAEFFDFGVDVAIGAPPAAEVVDIDEWSAPKPCVGGGAPLSGTDVSDALRRHGFEVTMDDECFGAQVAGVVTENGIRDDGGDAYCVVYRDERSVVLASRAAGGWNVRNVHCMVFGQTTPPGLERAVAELERIARP